MSNTIGNSFRVSIFGESHGPKIGCVIDGLTPGVKIDLDYIKECLTRRTKYSLNGRKEPDGFQIVSGVYNGYSTGAPICILIDNKDANSKDYSFISDEHLARPSHADYTNHLKYNGFENPLVGGHSSGP